MPKLGEEGCQNLQVKNEMSEARTKDEDALTKFHTLTSIPEFFFHEQSFHPCPISRWLWFKVKGFAYIIGQIQFPMKIYVVFAG